MKVGEVCNREVVIVERGETILEAAKLMRHYHIGDVVVVQDGKPVGILTDRDIVVELLAKEVDLTTVTIGDAMSFNLVTAREEDDLSEAIVTMRNKGVRRIPVVDHRGRLAGILSTDDYLELVTEELEGMVNLIKTEQRQELQNRP